MVPGTSATVFVTLATTGDIPIASSTGKLTKVPPPAIAFMKPAVTPAKKTSISFKTDIRKFSEGKYLKVFTSDKKYKGFLSFPYKVEKNAIFIGSEKIQLNEIISIKNSFEGKTAATALLVTSGTLLTAGGISKSLNDNFLSSDYDSSGETMACIGLSAVLTGIIVGITGIKYHNVNWEFYLE